MPLPWFPWPSSFGRRNRSRPSAPRRLSPVLRLVAALLLPVQALSATPVYAWMAQQRLQISLGAAAPNPTPVVPVPAPPPADPTLGLVVVHTAVPPTSLSPARPAFSETPADGEFLLARVLPEALVPMGGAPTTPEENRELADALRTFRACDPDHPERTLPLEDFLARHPRSAWRGALQLNLGLLHRQAGRFSRALAAWEDAWTHARTQPAGDGVSGESATARLLADRALAELAELNARVGRVERLAALFAEVEGRDVRGAATEKLAGARTGLWLMRHEPDRSFRCGPFALGRVLAATGELTPALSQKVYDSTSTPRGLSLPAVQAFARDQLGQNLRMAYREPGAEVIVPAVANWRLGHYAALVRENRPHRFLVQDPTFTDDLVISTAALDEESSGYFLVPADRELPAGWREVDAAEGAAVWGKGTVPPNTPCPPPCVAPKINDCPTCDGSNPAMAGYNVDPSRVSLIVTDTPLFYSPPRGRPVSFTVSYSQREVAPVAAPTYSNLGPKWSFNWLAYIVDDPHNAATQSYGPGGGTLKYGGYVAGGTANTGKFALQSQARSGLHRTGPAAYEKTFADGSRQIYNLSDGGSPAKVFLTQAFDAQGNSTTFTYDAWFRLASVTDALGQVSTLTHQSDVVGNPGFYLVARVTDPFGRFAAFTYNAAGQLETITDPVGIVSRFRYGGGDFINQLTTPYGDTRFAYADVSARHRWLEVIDPHGDKERVEFMEDAVGPDDPAKVPSAPGFLTNTSYQAYRNTFHWDKKGYKQGYPDPAKARLLHWAHTPDGNSASDVLESEKQPFENRVYYNYPGQSTAYLAGTLNLPSKVARVLDDGTTQLTQTDYNARGKVTRQVDPLGRTTTYAYSTDGVDLLAVYQQNPAGVSTDPFGQPADRLAAYTYNAAHQPLTVTDASGRTTVYTYNAHGQVLTVTPPARAAHGGQPETTTFNYTGATVGGTTRDGYLRTVTGPVSGAVSTFGYDALGRLRTVQTYEGDTTTLAYDAVGGDVTRSLNRVVRVTHPDGTFEQTLFNRLDAEWTRDRLNRWTHTFHNALRQVIYVVDPEGRWTGLEWCKCGSLQALVDGAGNRTRWTYDVQGRRTAKTYADGRGDTFAYWPASGRLKSVTDAKGQVATYAYFRDNALQSVTYTNAAVATPTVSFTYDPVYPRTQTMTDGLGTTTYAFNPVPNVATTPTVGAGALASVDGTLADDTLAFTYDEWRRLVGRTIHGAANAASVSFDGLGRLANITNALGTFTHAYEGVTGRLDHVDYPNGQRAEFTYFPLSGGRRLQQIKNLGVGGGANPPVLSQFDYAYDAAGQIKTWGQAHAGNTTAQPAISYTFGYDLAGQLTGAAQKNAASGAPLAQLAYGYDQAANRVTDQRDSAVSTAAHNNLNQLTGQTAGGAMRFAGTLSEPASVTVNGNAARVDAAGNFEGAAQVVAGSNTVSITATDSSGNAATRQFQVTVPAADPATLAYDLNGNLLNDGAGHTFEYDAADRCTAVNTAAGNLRSEFSYDGGGRRARIVEKANGSVTSTKVFVFDTLGLGRPAEERDASNAVTRRFFGQGEIRVSGGATTKLFYARDHLGSVRELTDEVGTVQARYDYGLWGQRTKLNGDLDTEVGFTGYWQHQQSGYALSPTRLYSAQLGRFTSKDPIQERGGVNLYGYCLNQVVNSIDPDGRDVVSWLLTNEWNPSAETEGQAYDAFADQTECTLRCMRENNRAAFAGMFGGAAGAAPTALASALANIQVRKEILPPSLRPSLALSGLGKGVTSDTTSALRVISTATGAALGARNPIHLAVQSVANALKRGGAAAAMRMGARGGVAGAAMAEAALAWYCAKLCSDCNNKQ